MNIALNPNDIWVATVIIGIVEFIKKFFPQVNGSVTILTCAVLGGLFGLFNINGLNVTSGILVGLGATGSHQLLTNNTLALPTNTVQNIINQIKSTPVESAVEKAVEADLQNVAKNTTENTTV